MDLYPYQARVYDLLAGGHSVILRAPTGAGKTQAALYPFLAAMDSQSNLHGLLPRKCIYSVPMRVLAKQFHAEYGATVHRYNTRFNLEISTQIQTGDMPQDPELRSDLIFATIDQTLSSFLMAPYGLSRGKANLNLGAILASYLVFDEFHLYDPDSTLPTVLEMLRMLDGIVPFVLMTATFSDELIERLARILKAEVVGLSPADREAFAGLQSQQKTRRYHATPDILTPDIILDKHQGRSVVICNTVARARSLAQKLRQDTAGDDTEVILLHSQFLRPDRDRIEADIRQRFGKHDNGTGSLIVVATQAIEVGVDMTSTVMHTELAPANAIIQRAGRCARYRGDVGDIYIYRRVCDADCEIVDLYEKTNPYSGVLQIPQVAATCEAFQSVSGQKLDFAGEQQIIDLVHAAADQQVLSDLESDRANHRQAMFATMRGDKDHVGELVRKVVAQPVTIHDNPESLQYPYRLPAFSVHPGVLRQWTNDWLIRWNAMPDDPDIPDWAIKYLHQAETHDHEGLTWAESVQWVPVTLNADDNFHIPYGTLVIVHPALASYTSTEGLIPEFGGGWENGLTIVDDNPKADRSEYTYRLETYAEHIRLVYQAAFVDDREIGHRAYWHELLWAIQELADRLELSVEDIRQAAELTVLLHDVGKLSTDWQGWVREYQAAIGMPVNETEAYAHTERQTEAHRVAEHGLRRRRPHHAVESAVAVVPLLLDLPINLRQAVFTAISRHHGAFTENVSTFRLESYALDQVNATLSQPAAQLLDCKQPVSNQMFSTPHDSTFYQFLAYALLVRLLRRADTKGTAWGSI